MTQIMTYLKNIKIAILATLAASLTMSCKNLDRAEITWSIMHPTQLDTAYMAKVISQSSGYTVDNFEVCGGCNSFSEGSLDGLLLFEEYPLAAREQNLDVVNSNRASIKRIVEMAHEVDKQVYYWHREVICNKGMIASVPDLLDEDGEFNLLGEAYEKLLKYKISKTFELVPDLDGLVLTLTEADYSALHNSNQERYPADKVVEKIGGIFAQEMKDRGKRFILRTFGNLDENYITIENGAKLLAEKYSFEIETKITPFDFSPFMPDNVYLRAVKGCTIGAECDALGEYLGAGRMPAENIEDVVRYVAYAQKCKVDRYTIRLDRHHYDVFDNYPINIYAYEQAILNPGITADEIRMQYYSRFYSNDTASTLARLSKNGYNCILKTNFIDGHLIFHQFPTDPVMKFIKSSGIPAVFAKEGSLEMKNKQWGILYDKNVPGREQIIAEKKEALDLALESLALLESIKDDISAEEYQRLLPEWKCLCNDALATLDFCKVICAYFDGIEAMDAKGTALNDAYNKMRAELDGMDCTRPYTEIASLFVNEYPEDIRMRNEILQGGNIIDYILPGSAFDEIRHRHFMHGAFPAKLDKDLAIAVGNKVLPNTYLEVHMQGSESPALLFINGDGGCEVHVNGAPFTIQMSWTAIPLEANPDGYDIIIRKTQEEQSAIITSIILQENKINAI